MTLDELEELGPVSIDAERIGQAEGDQTVRGVSDLGSLEKRLLGRLRIPEVTLEVSHAGRADQLGIDVVRGEVGAGPEKGEHRPLGIRADEHQAAGRRRTAAGGLGPERDPGGPDVSSEHRAELVVADFPDVRGPAAQGDQADHGVRRRPARALDGVGDQRVETLGTVRIDQRHRALGQGMVREEPVVGVCQDIHDRVSQADDVVGGPGGGLVHRLVHSSKRESALYR